MLIRSFTFDRLFVVLLVFALHFAASTSAARPRQPTLAPPQELDDAPLWVAPEESAKGPALTVLNEEESTSVEEVLPAPMPQPQPDAGPASPLPASQHPWGRFEPGAWRRLVIVSESFDENGVLVGRSETQRTESLVNRTASQYTLKLETVIDVSGKRLPGPMQELTLGLLTDSPLVATSIDIGEPTTISLQGQAIPCEQWLLTLPTGPVTASSEVTKQSESVETLYYNAETFPYLLRRKRQEIVEGKTVGEQTTNVVRVGVPTVLESKILSAYHTTTLKKSPSGPTTERQGVHALEIPGGLVSESATEFDATGRRVRWTVTRLAAYGLRAEETAAVAAAPSAGRKTPSTDPEADEPRPRRLLRMLRRAEKHAAELEGGTPLLDQIAPFLEGLEGLEGTGLESSGPEGPGVE